MFEFFQKGGFLMYPLLLCSVITMAIGIERTYQYARMGGRKNIVSDIIGCLLKGDYDKAIKIGTEGNSPVATVITEAIRNRGPVNMQAMIMGQTIARYAAPWSSHRLAVMRRIRRLHRPSCNVLRR